MYKVITALSFALAGLAMACRADTDCALGDRIYRLAEADRLRFGALISFHGVSGSAAGTMETEPLREFAEREDLALVAAEAALDDWNIQGLLRRIKPTRLTNLHILTPCSKSWSKKPRSI
ncbi:hypothetical protein [uncultured Roseobacter sp.]|uniref:hypothetical protein n=1 Tax=uncultured Roseobacter sp. TaxID=114847 RepID=UPI00263441DF|nr:hypothetical protein [uncultured Roseobacter sp.]